MHVYSLFFDHLLNFVSCEKAELPHHAGDVVFKYYIVMIEGGKKSIHWEWFNGTE